MRLIKNKNGDPDWTRTNDFYRVKVALSQLSYGIGYCGTILTIVCPMNKVNDKLFILFLYLVN